MSITLVGWVNSTYVWAFTKDISKESFSLSVDQFFPSWSNKAQNASGKGINNVTGLIQGLIPLITTLMAVGAVLMVILGGFYMIFWWANPSQTETWKSVIKDAILGLTVWLLAYVILLLVWGKKLVGITSWDTGLPGEGASNVITILKSVISKLQDVTAIIAVLGICIVWIMYIMSQGNEEKTEAAKKYMITIMIGVLLAFAAWGIMSLINLIPNSFIL